MRLIVHGAGSRVELLFTQQAMLQKLGRIGELQLSFPRETAYISDPIAYDLAPS